MSSESVKSVSAPLRRLVFAVLVFAGSAAATLVLAQILAPGGAPWINAALLVLFAVLFSWISASFWTVMIGFAAMLADRLRARWKPPPVPALPEGGPRPGASRTALLVPICNEDTRTVFARIEAMVRSVRATAMRDAFDVFVLSDSTDPEAWVEEEIAWSALARRLGAEGRIFYRHRTDNAEFKSGNIADFCQRWGRDYRYMIVLDADSLMTGRTMAELVRRMDANPRLGLLQTPPMPVRAETLFARMHQFAAALYGPAYARGAAFWQMGEGNYWGHNAIIRVGAFMANCGLPALPGARPFGGHILSHDFVEAALLVRAGWEVRLATDLADSFEEVPSNLLAFAKRDYRWCQGNLQHLRPMLARGLHPLSRVHLGMGIMTYLAAPVWLTFIVLSAYDLWRRTHTPHVYFSEQSFFPLWPISHAAEAEILLGATVGILFLPKLLAFLFLCFERDRAAAFGGRLAAAAGAVTETVLSVLIAPILMAFHTRFVVLTLLGRHTPWRPQRRAGPDVPWGTAVAAHAGQTAAALAAGYAAWTWLPELFWWLVPVLAGPVLAIPLSVLLASETLGRRARAWRLFLAPCESRPPPVLRAFERALGTDPGAVATAADPAVNRVLDDARLNALHAALLARTGTAAPKPRESVLRQAVSGGLASLPVAAQRAVLSHPESVMVLHALRLAGEPAQGAESMS